MVVVAAIIWAIVSSLQFISKEGNSAKMTNDWGIAKDSPIR